MSRFIEEGGDWTKYRSLPNLREFDFHNNEDEESCLPYWERMENVWNDSLKVLETSQASGVEYVLFTHGWSTSYSGNITSRSQVRKLMRSKESTPYIIRKKCIQHDSVFVAAIRPKVE